MDERPTPKRALLTKRWQAAIRTYLKINSTTHYASIFWNHTQKQVLKHYTKERSNCAGQTQSLLFLLSFTHYA